MTAACEKLDAFADGALAPGERADFLDHLCDCARCPGELEVVFALRGLAETMPAAPVANPVRRKLRRPAIAVGGAALAAAGALLVLRPGPEVWSYGETRPIEARLEDPRAAVYQPFDELRGTTPAPRDPSYPILARLQRSGDHKGLVSRLLLDGDLTQARAILAGADATLDNERAVLALLEGRPGEAVVHSERVLARAPHAAPPLWNRALALRELGLDRAAAEGFAAIVARGEPGWSVEAGRWAERLAADARARRTSWQAAVAAARQLARAQVPPPTEIVTRAPELSRAAFYEAVRGAEPTALAGLAALAERLDAHFGGRVLGDALVRLQSADLARRAALAARYRAVMVGDLALADPGPAAPGSDPTLLADLRAAGAVAADLRLGLLLATGAGATREAQQLAAKGGDPWLALRVALALAAGQPDGDARLAEHAAEARARGFTRLALAGDLDLIRRLGAQGRRADAFARARGLHAAARAGGQLDFERAALAELARAAGPDLALAQVYQHEHAALAAP